METEITVEVYNEFAQIQDILEKSGYQMIENYQINDWYFSKFDDISRLEYAELMSNSFLVRQIVDNNSKVQIVFKKKILDANNNVISEEKTTALVSDLENTLNIFKNANLNNYCTLKNNSFVYKKEEVCFVVQLIDDLGIFIEYEEDDTMKNMSANEKFEHMSCIVKKLGLSLGDDYSCKKVYMKIKQKAL